MTVKCPETYVSPIVEQPLPSTLDVLRTWIGMIMWIAPHIPFIGDKLQPFHDYVAKYVRKTNRAKTQSQIDEMDTTRWSGAIALQVFGF